MALLHACSGILSSAAVSVPCAAPQPSPAWVATVIGLMGILPRSERCVEIMKLMYLRFNIGTWSSVEQGEGAVFA
ncbi:predicted protein [Plenodomus lingam JN3]|uniref:Predicted protein n=1 Tax=Leptosphaeria maculans (strain JN3 / isolate v23.1.3 / race Av1-4-5-6-7-8) TaxID=985895 RepID=E4ZKB4_LEPMJ|nr:predicted protein [Plenodomus lingam JN3]CBX91709.1 predicted protein [Plenodomus lingam JN3]